MLSFGFCSCPVLRLVLDSRSGSCSGLEVEPKECFHQRVEWFLILGLYLVLVLSGGRTRESSLSENGFCAPSVQAGSGSDFSSRSESGSVCSSGSRSSSAFFVDAETRVFVLRVFQRVLSLVMGLSLGLIMGLSLVPVRIRNQGSLCSRRSSCASLTTFS